MLQEFYCLVMVDYYYHYLWHHYVDYVLIFFHVIMVHLLVLMHNNIIYSKRSLSRDETKKERNRGICFNVRKIGRQYTHARTRGREKERGNNSALVLYIYIYLSGTVEVCNVKLTGIISTAPRRGFLLFDIISGIGAMIFVFDIDSTTWCWFDIDLVSIFILIKIFLTSAALSMNTIWIYFNDFNDLNSILILI